jgi:hypothetical protein
VECNYRQSAYIYLCLGWAGPLCTSVAPKTSFSVNGFTQFHVFFWHR